MERKWRDVIPDEDYEIYKESGFKGVQGVRLGLGERPALIIIDIQHRTVGLDKPTLESIRHSGFPTSCGDVAWAAVRATARLLKVARAASVPVFYAIIERNGAVDAGLFSKKLSGITSDPIHRPGNRGTEIPEEIAPVHGDFIISKRQSSAFFGTSLVTQLNMLRADSLIITGCSTSGCVRATACDAFSYAIPATVVEECVYDRSQLSHKVSLFEIGAKYADVMTLADLERELTTRIPNARSVAA
jgi:maleamate amidohydrolase